jgi:hypothetical protein
MEMKCSQNSLLGYDYPRLTEQARVGLLCSTSDFTQGDSEDGKQPILKDKLLNPSCFIPNPIKIISDVSWHLKLAHQLIYDKCFDVEPGRWNTDHERNIFELLTSFEEMERCVSLNCLLQPID